MPLLDLLLGPSKRVSITYGQPRSLDEDGWPMFVRTTASGIAVDEEVALTYAPVFAACRIVAETLAMMPRILYERQDDEGRERVKDGPLAPLAGIIGPAPNPMMAGMPFWEGRHLHADEYGDGFAEIERDARGDTSALWPIHAGRVRAPYANETYESGRAMAATDYVVTNNDGKKVGIPAENMLHIPGVLSEDGVWGKGLVAYGRESIGYGIAIEKYGSNYFKTGGQPKAVIYLPGMRDPETRNRFREEWRQVHNQNNGGDIFIIPVQEGKYERLTHTPEEAQHLQTRADNVKAIARIWRIPVYMLEEGEHQTYASVEMRGLEFVIYSLLPRAARVEGQIALKLLRPEQRGQYYVEHLFAALLRGDFKTRMDGYRTALGNGIMTINEVRRLENLPAIGPAGDEHYVPLNMTTADRMEQGLPPPGQPAKPSKPAAVDSTRVEDILIDMREELKGYAVSAAVPALPLALPAPAARPPDGLRPVLLAVAADACRRWLLKCSTAAAREQKNNAFPRWLEGFHNEQRAKLAESLAPMAVVLVQMGHAVTGADLAERLQGHGKAYLLAAYDGDTREQFAQRLAEWPSRAGQTAKAVLSEWVDFQKDEEVYSAPIPHDRGPAEVADSAKHSVIPQI